MFALRIQIKNKLIKFIFFANQKKKNNKFQQPTYKKNMKMQSTHFFTSCPFYQFLKATKCKTSSCYGFPEDLCIKIYDDYKNGLSDVEIMRLCIFTEIKKRIDNETFGQKSFRRKRPYETDADFALRKGCLHAAKWMYANNISSISEECLYKNVYPDALQWIISNFFNRWHDSFYENLCYNIKKSNFKIIKMYTAFNFDDVEKKTFLVNAISSGNLWTVKLVLTYFKISSYTLDFYMEYCIEEAIFQNNKFILTYFLIEMKRIRAKNNNINCFEIACNLFSSTSKDIIEFCFDYSEDANSISTVVFYLLTTYSPEKKEIIEWLIEKYSYDTIFDAYTKIVEEKKTILKFQGKVWKIVFNHKKKN